MMIARLDNTASCGFDIFVGAERLAWFPARRNSHLYLFLNYVMRLGYCEGREDIDGWNYHRLNRVSVIINKKIVGRVVKISEVLRCARSWRVGEACYKYFIYVRRKCRDEKRNTGDCYIYKRMSEDDMLDEYLTILNIERMTDEMKTE